MIVKLINHYYEMFSEEEMTHSLIMKKFSHKIKSKGFIHDTETKGLGLDEITTGFYGEYIDPEYQPSEEELDIKYDNEQSLEAIDMESDEDNDD